jgi:hypothetical protein
VKLSIFIDDHEHVIEGSYATYFQYHSSAQVCPVCLRLWAKVHVEGTTWFYIETYPCENCPWPWKNSGIPGSLLASDEARGPLPLLDVLPRPLVEREFRVHLKAFGALINDKPHDLFAQRRLERSEPSSRS